MHLRTLLPLIPWTVRIGTVWALVRYREDWTVYTIDNLIVLLWLHHFTFFFFIVIVIDTINWAARLTFLFLWDSIFNCFCHFTFYCNLTQSDSFFLHVSSSIWLIWVEWIIQALSCIIVRHRITIVWTFVTRATDRCVWSVNFLFSRDGRTIFSRKIRLTILDLVNVGKGNLVIQKFIV